jgi:hypothetical protein
LLRYGSVIKLRLFVVGALPNKFTAVCLLSTCASCGGIVGAVIYMLRIFRGTTGGDCYIIGFCGGGQGEGED